jgi:hypothetical protein
VLEFWVDPRGEKLALFEGHFQDPEKGKFWDSQNPTSRVGSGTLSGTDLTPRQHQDRHSSVDWDRQELIVDG